MITCLTERSVCFDPFINQRVFVQYSSVWELSTDAAYLQLQTVGTVNSTSSRHLVGLGQVREHGLRLVLRHGQSTPVARLHRRRHHLRKAGCRGWNNSVVVCVQHISQDGFLRPVSCHCSSTNHGRSCLAHGYQICHDTGVPRKHIFCVAEYSSEEDIE